MYFKILLRVTQGCKIKQFHRLFYDTKSKHDTIFALSTAIKPTTGSPLGVIRISGSKTANVIHKFTGLHVPTHEQTLSIATKKLLLPRYATLAKVTNPGTQEPIDIGLIIWFPKPNSYSGEDTCEFHLHGSHAVLTSVLSALGNIDGLRPAEAGEFTRRSVLNGKMSLLQAESLSDLISAKTDGQRKLALRGLDSSTRSKYESWIQGLVSVLAHLEASIDFGEDELIGEEAVVASCISKLKALSEAISVFVKINRHRRDLVQNGLRVAILGRPNAGKSSFMNLLCRHDKSIVSDLSGTTRDVIEHSLDINGHAITLCDTAGLRDLQSMGRDKLTEILDGGETNLVERHRSIESEGIRRALDAARSADLIVYLVDASSLPVDESVCIGRLADELAELAQKLESKSTPTAIHLVINKVDLNDRLSETIDAIKIESALNVQPLKFGNDLRVTMMSCKTRKNFESFIASISSMLDEKLVFPIGEADPKTEDPSNVDYVNERHLALLQSAERHLSLASSMDMSTLDKMAQHVRESVDYLSRVVGTVSNEDVIDVIFRDFCIGK